MMVSKENPLGCASIWQGCDFPAVDQKLLIISLDQSCIHGTPAEGQAGQDFLEAGGGIS